VAAVLVLYRQKGFSTKQSAFNAAGYVAFTTVDEANVLTGNYPIIRPTDTSTAFSYEVRLFLGVTQAPVTNVTNIRFWSNVALPATRTFFWVGTAVASAAPVNTRSVKAKYRSTAYYGPGTSLLWSDKTLTAVGHNSHTLVMQLFVTSGSPVGDTVSENAVQHFSYEES
jgi:hypothetical protein